MRLASVNAFTTPPPAEASHSYDAAATRFASTVPLSVAFALIGLTACSPIKPRPDLPIDVSAPPGEITAIDRACLPEETAHPAQSAFRLLIEGTEAFVIRAHSARMAERSLDVQTYIWHADLTGLYLAHAALDAADRGVKVRLLVDDLDARAKSVGFAALAAHPKIEVRMFNPFSSRSGILAKIGEGLTNFDRINRRMHNKTWIADNRVAIAGGRNIGDEYFSASDAVNFVDLDFAMVGPIVRDASVSFDKYWNSPAAYPIEVLDPDSVTPAMLTKLREVLTSNTRAAESSAYAKGLAGDDAIRSLLDKDRPLQWSDKYQFVSDDPLKIGMQERDESRTLVAAALVSMLDSAEQGATITSPYFVPGEFGTRTLAGAAQAGKKIRVLTNSLVANDVAAVHGGYARYREPLLVGGVQLWELKPSGSSHSTMFGSSGASLHTKALSVDGRKSFVGSYNLDPRSTWLNCEQGVLVDNAVLAAQLEAIFAKQTEGQRAWRVTLEGVDLKWNDGAESFDSDPHASIWHRFQAWFASVTGMEAQL